MFVAELFISELLRSATTAASEEEVYSWTSSAKLQVASIADQLLDRGNYESLFSRNIRKEVETERLCTHRPPATKSSRVSGKP